MAKFLPFRYKDCMTSKKLPFTRVESIVQDTLKGIKVEETFKVYPIWKQWKELVGEAIASKTAPDYIKGSTLFVSVDHPVWVTELQFQKKVILEKIATLNLSYPVQDIYFQLKK